MQVHVPTRGGIARFVVVWERFRAFGRMAWGPPKSPQFVRFVMVSEPLSARFWVLQWFRTDVGDVVIRIQDLGAGMARFAMISEKFQASAGGCWGLKKSIHDREASIAASLVTSGSESIRDREASIALRPNEVMQPLARCCR